MSLQEDQPGDQVSEDLYIDDSGHTSIETRWGDYVITSEEIIGLEHYSMSDTTVSLSPNMTKSVKLYIEFNYKHPDSTLNSISEIREDIEFITNESYDVVIPSYYASVAETILEFVETIPNRGQFFIDTSYTPTEMTEAYLSAASELVSVITETMRSKRNVDLFVACEDMPATEIYWDSDELPGTFLSPFGENRIDKSKLRDDIITRHRDMNDFINEKKQAVNETSPVSEMHQNVTKVMQIDTQSEAIEVAHTIAVSIMLDAIEESFDHEEIMNRLSQTVF
jgi:Rad3-related DNA helicase